MENNEERLDQFISKILSEDISEKPSLDFTTGIMDKVEALSSKSTITTYKPLISKWVWCLLALLFIGLVWYFTTKDVTYSESILYKYIEMPNIQNPFKSLSFNFSSILMYAMVLLALMISVQIPIFKHHFNKRLSL